MTLINNQRHVFLTETKVMFLYVVCKTRLDMTASKIDESMNHANQSKSAVSVKEKRLICITEMITVVRVKANIAGTMARTPNACF